jgi:hypothetical protein
MFFVQPITHYSVLIQVWIPLDRYPRLRQAAAQIRLPRSESR